MTTLLLVRHATTAETGLKLSGRLPGIPLDERGRSQAAATAERLRPVRLSAVYSSPLARCRETAEAIAEPRGLDVSFDDRLLEIGFGDWTGRPLRALARTKLWGAVQSTPSRVRFPGAGGESFLEAVRRSAEAVEEIAAAHRRSTVAVVSHGDVIRLLLAHLAGVPLDLFQRIVVSPASVSAVALGEGPPRILRVNETGSLADLAPPPRSRRSAQRTGPRGVRG